MPSENTSSAILKSSMTLSAFSSPNGVSDMTHERLHSGLSVRFTSPSFSSLSSVRDIVVTSSTHRSASSLWLIAPLLLKVLSIRGCPCPTVSPSSIKCGLSSCRLSSSTLKKALPNPSLSISISIPPPDGTNSNYKRVSLMYFHSCLITRVQTVPYKVCNISLPVQAAQHGFHAL